MNALLIGLGLVAWLVLAAVVGMGIGRVVKCRDEQVPDGPGACLGRRDRTGT